MIIHRWQGTDGKLGEASNYSSNTAPTVAATGILTLSGNAVDTETVTIDAKVYTFQDTLTDVDGNVHIGATASDSIDNLIDAINLGAGAGVDYATSMTLHPTISAAAGAGDTLDASAKIKGSDANTIVTTETMSAGSWGGATVSGGTQWATADSVVWDKTSTQPVTTAIGPASPVVQVALAWIEEGYKEDFAAFDFAPLKLVHQGRGAMIVNIPTIAQIIVVVVDSSNAIDAMLLDGPNVSGSFIEVKRGKLTVAAGFNDITYLSVLTGGEAMVPA